MDSMQWAAYERVAQREGQVIIIFFPDGNEQSQKLKMKNSM